MTSPNPAPNLEPVQPDLQTQPAVESVGSRRSLPLWRFLMPLLFQAALIVAIPAQDAYTVVSGRTVVLQTAPVDPYDLLRGYYQTLSYDISTIDRLKSLPGGDQVFNHSTRAVAIYVVLEASTAQTTPPKPWKPVAVSTTLPKNLPANQVALVGQMQDGWRVTYGLEQYYMPEDQRTGVNDDINLTQRQSPQAFVVEAKVDAQGNAVPMSLWVKDRNYRF